MAALAAANQTAIGLLTRHAAGDWGEVDDEERTENWSAIGGNSGSVASVFRLANGSALIVVTEMEPRQTSILLAEEA